MLSSWNKDIIVIIIIIIDEGEVVGAIFFGLKKAFNIVDHDFLLNL